MTLTIKRGETLGLVGESGCGKSTVGRAILRLYGPTSGRITFDGRDITHLVGLGDASRCGGACRWCSRTRTRRSTRGTPSGRWSVSRCASTDIASGAETDARVQELLEVVGLPADAATRYPHEFSGGQRQRIGLARALALNPELVVCDEPVSALDVSIQAQIVNLLEELQDEFGLTYLFIAHDLAVVQHISDRIAVMYLGKVVEVAPARRPVRQPAAPVHDRAALGDPDPRSGGGAQPATRSASAGDLPEPGQPADRVPLPHEVPVRAADALRRRGAAAALRRRTPRRLPLRRGDQGRRDQPARARPRSRRNQRRAALTRSRDCTAPPPKASSRGRPISDAWTLLSARRSSTAIETTAVASRRLRLDAARVAAAR